VDENTAEEEHGLVNGAGPVDVLVPYVANRQALKDGQAGANDDPEHSHHEQNLDGDPDHGELEDAPVEGEEGDLGGGDGRGVAEGADPQVEARSLYPALGSFGVGRRVVDVGSKAIVDCCWDVYQPGGSFTGEVGFRTVEDNRTIHRCANLQRTM
jgi:hypothetical protein